MHSVARALLFLLPLAGSRLVMAQTTKEASTVKDTFGDAVDSVSSFFTGGDPVKMASKFPTCVASCFNTNYKSVCPDVKDIDKEFWPCICGDDKGKSFQGKLSLCGGVRINGNKECDDMDDVEIDDLCEALDGKDDKVKTETREALTNALAGKAQTKEEDSDDAKGNATASGAGALGNTAAGALAAAFGFAVALL